MARVAGGLDEATGTPYFAPFVGGHAAAAARARHEAAFARPGAPAFPGQAPEHGSAARAHADEARYPYMADHYEDAKHAVTRARWRHEAKALGGAFGKPAFVPGGRSAGPGGSRTTGAALAERPTRALLPELVREAHACLAADWGETNFTVASDPADDHIEVRFEARTVDAPRALLGYMNTLATDNSQALPQARWYARYGLRRAVDGWGAGPDAGGWITFAFRPPWAKPRATAEAFTALHPSTATFRSGAAASRADPFEPTRSYAPSLVARPTARPREAPETLGPTPAFAGGQGPAALAAAQAAASTMTGGGFGSLGVGAVSEMGLGMRGMP